jgi:hypothetical protein
LTEPEVTSPSCGCSNVIHKKSSLTSTIPDPLKYQIFQCYKTIKYLPLHSITL